MTTTETHLPATDLREYIRILRARKWEVGIVAAVLVLATLLFTFRQTPIYEGQAKVLVKPIQTLGTQLTIAQAPNLDTERELILSQAVADRVIADLALRVDSKDLLEDASVQVVTDTEVLVIKYADPSPEEASRVANGFANAYVVFRAQQAFSQFETAAAGVQQRIDGIQEQLAELNRRIQGAPDETARTELQSQRDNLIAQLGVLNQQLLNLQSTQTVNAQAAEIVQPASVPDSPVSPNKVRNGVLALFAGVGLGIAFAFLRERLDDRIKSRQELERRLGAPVISAVPKVSGWKSRDDAQLVMRSDPKSPVSEAYRTLGTNVQYMASRQPLKVIMITSSLGGDGKTTTSANLAVVLAQAGRHVILVSCDLRRPRIHHFFGVRNDIGMSNVLSDSTSLSAVAKDPGIVNLRVIAGGPQPQDPAALLGSIRAGEFVESLREAADFVIIDTPPVLAVADASILSPLVDGTIFVVDAERSSRSAMTQARDQLENAGANIVGAIFNNFDPSASGYYPYYYYNYYYQYSGTDEGANGSRLRSRLARRNRRGLSAGRAARPTQEVGGRRPNQQTVRSPLGSTREQPGR